MSIKLGIKYTPYAADLDTPILQLHDGDVPLYLSLHKFLPTFLGLIEGIQENMNEHSGVRRE